jgi:WD40-like Beta Propeller Repeat
VWVTSRISRNVDFGQGTRVNGLPLGLGYCSLTADERSIFCEVGPPARKPQVWQATRPSLTAAFGPPSPVLELMSGDEDGDPSITADGTQLVYATTRSGSSDLRVFRRACQ